MSKNKDKAKFVFSKLKYLSSPCPVAGRPCMTHTKCATPEHNFYEKLKCFNRISELPTKRWSKIQNTQLRQGIFLLTHIRVTLAVKEFRFHSNDSGCCGSNIVMPHDQGRPKLYFLKWRLTLDIEAERYIVSYY